jgi:hypothetical protein
MANRWGIPKEVEELVKKRDVSCVYCGIQFTNSNISHKSRSTWEHIINDIRINGPENIALCCGSCNASKGAKPLEEWLESKYCNTKGITINNVASIVKEHIERK